MSKQLDENGINIVYAQGIRDLLVAARAARLSTSKPAVLVTSHSSYTWRCFAKSIGFILLARLFSDGLILLQEDLYRKWRQKASRVGLPLWYVSNAVNTDAMIHKKRLRSGDVLHSGYVSVIHPMKGQDLLPKAAQLLRDRRVKAIFHLVGDTMDEAYRARLLSDISERGLRDWFVLHGVVDPSALPELMLGWDAYICPSLCEMMPLNVLEALASGLPVVASNIPGVRDAVKDGENGLLFTSGDASEMADCITRVFDQSTLSRMSINARGTAERCFTPWVVGRRYAEIFRDALDKRQKRK